MLNLRSANPTGTSQASGTVASPTPAPSGVNDTARRWSSTHLQYSSSPSVVPRSGRTPPIGQAEQAPVSHDPVTVKVKPEEDDDEALYTGQGSAPTTSHAGTAPPHRENPGTPAAPNRPTLTEFDIGNMATAQRMLAPDSGADLETREAAGDYLSEHLLARSSSHDDAGMEHRQQLLDISLHILHDNVEASDGTVAAANAYLRAALPRAATGSSDATVRQLMHRMLELLPLGSRAEAETRTVADAFLRAAFASGDAAALSPGLRDELRPMAERALRPFSGAKNETRVAVNRWIRGLWRP